MSIKIKYMSKTKDRLRVVCYKCGRAIRDGYTVNGRCSHGLHLKCIHKQFGKIIAKQVIAKLRRKRHLK